MLTDEKRTKLAAAGREFDSMVQDLVYDGNASEPVDALGMLENLVGEQPDLKDAVAQLKLIAEQGTSPESTIRLSAARAIARRELNKIQSDGDNAPQAIRDAIQTFADHDRLETSGVDIIAAAILLPKEGFGNVCYAANHASGALARKFDVPLGVVTLRQHVLHPGEQPVPTE